MTYPSIRLERTGSIGELILNKPTKRNALSVDMWQAIPELMRIAAEETDINVVIIHGGDAGAFASGADISEFETIYATPESAERSGDTIEAALSAIETCAKPVIAAIDGACFGGGVSMAMAADLRVGARSATFGVTPGRLGLVYPAGDTRRLLAAIGPGPTKDILFTGRAFDAEEAFEISLLDRLVEPGEALAAAHAFASDISAISQWSVRATKRMIRGMQNGGREEDAAPRQLFLDGFANEDFQEGYRAFLEKRPANFTFK